METAEIVRDLLLPPVDCRTSSLKIASSLISDVRLTCILPTSPTLRVLLDYVEY